MENLVRRLNSKGWEKKDIQKTLEIIKKAKQNKGKEMIFLERRIFFLFLVIVLIANFAISAALLPALAALKGFWLYFILAVIGVSFGFVFEIVIRSIEHLEKKHHLMLAIFIPVVSLVNFFVISNFSNKLITSIGFKNVHNPLLVAVVYSLSFVMPYLVYRFVIGRGYYSK